MSEGESSSLQKGRRQVRVRFFGPIIAVVKRSEDVVTLPRGKMSVIELIDVLCSRYGDEFRDLAIHNGTLNRGLVVGVNGECVLDPSQDVGEDDRVQLSLASQMEGG